MLDSIKRLHELLLHINSSKIVLLDGKQALTGNELFQKASELAAFFAQKGAKFGDRIAVQLPNSIEFILCYFAGIVGGYTIVPINSSLPQRDIDYILASTKPVYYVQKLEDLEFKKANIEYKIRSNTDSIIAIFFTSGTTNRPKGVCHTVENMLANASAFNELTGLDEQIRMLHVMPMGYMAGFLNTVLCPLLAGGCVVIAPQFNAKEAMNFWEPAISHHANSLWITPTMAAFLARLNRSKRISDWTKSHLRHVFVGTAPLHEATKTIFEHTFGVECLESYGMTEVMLVSANTLQYPRITRSVGYLLPGIEIQSRDQNGDSLATGQEGSLYIKTPFALQGYLDSETGKINSPLEEGWLATGDNGYIAHNNLFITGRIKDLIIRGGTNVSPRAIEEALLQHPDIQEATVIGKQHPFWGEEVVAFLILRENKPFNQAIIAAHCQHTLHADAVPSIFKILNEFPRSSTGKVQTNRLREML